MRVINTRVRNCTPTSRKECARVHLILFENKRFLFFSLGGERSCVFIIKMIQ